MSSGVPTRPTAMREVIRSNSSVLPVLPRAWGVSTEPGTMTLHRTPWGAYSALVVRVSWMTPGLAHPVGDRVGGGTHPGARRDVDNGAPAPDHVGDRVLGAQEHPPQVGVQRQVPDQFRHLGQRRRADQDPGVVYQHIQLPEALDGLFHHVAHLGGLGDVGFHEQGIAPHLGCQGRRLPTLRYVAIGHRHPGALPGEEERRGPAHAGGATSDDRNFVLETACHCFCSPPSRAEVGGTSPEDAGLRSSASVLASPDYGIPIG